MSKIEFYDESGLPEGATLKEDEACAAIKTAGHETMAEGELSSVEDEMQLEYEDKSRREEYVKHFRTNKGTYQARYYGSPVHYWNEQEGVYREIDNEFAEHTAAGSSDPFDVDGYENKYGSVKVRMARNLKDGKIASLVKGEYALSFNLTGRKRKNREDYEQSAGEASVFRHDRVKSKQRSINANALHEGPNGGEVRYNDFVSGADLQFILNGGQLKENIIIKQKSESYEYGFTLRTKNLRAVLSDDAKNVLFFPKTASDNTDPVFTLPAAFMTDNKGAYCDAVEYVLTKKNADGYILKVKPDIAWIESEEREFPVSVDPTVKFDKNSYITSGHVCSNLPNTVLGEENTVGYNAFYGFISTYVFVNSKCGNKVLNATYRTNLGKLLDKTREIRISKVTSIPSGALTWNTKPSSAGLYDIISCKDLVADSVSNPKNTLSIDITDIYNNSDFKGFAMESPLMNTYPVDTKIDSRTSFYSVLQGACITVDYILEDMIISDQQQKNSANRAGTGVLDLYTKNLQFVHQDFQLDNERLPITISHIYNQKYSMYNDVWAASMYSGEIGLGKGWKTNYHQYLFESFYNYGSTYNEGMPVPEYIYLDQYGNQHILTKTKIERHGKSTTYERKDESGSLEYTVDGARITLTARDGSKLLFERAGGANFYFRLTESKDAYENSVKISYLNGDRIGEIKDAATNRKAVFTYNTSGLLSSIKCSSLAGAKSRTVKYYYNAAQNLIRIDYPNEANGEYGVAAPQSGYTYDSTGRLTSARDQTGFKLTYEYSANNKITIKESTNIAAISHNAVQYCAENYRDTVVVDFGQERTTLTMKDGKKIIHVFDRRGQSYCSYVDNPNNSRYLGKDYYETVEAVAYKTSKGYESFSVSLTGMEKNLLENPYNTNCISYTTGGDTNYPLRPAYYVTPSAEVNKGPYVVYASATADCLPTHGGHRKLGLFGQIFYTDGTSEPEVFQSFNCRERGKQFAALGLSRSPANTHKTILHIAVGEDFSYNYGYVNFWNLHLVQAEFSRQTVTPVHYLIGPDTVQKHENFYRFGCTVDNQWRLEYTVLSIDDLIRTSTQKVSGSYAVIYSGDSVYTDRAKIDGDALIYYEFKDYKIIKAFDCMFKQGYVIESDNGTLFSEKKFIDYNGQLYKSQIINKSNGTTYENEYTYENGRIKTQKDFRGLVTEYTYNSFGVLTNTQTYLPYSANERFNNETGYSYENTDVRTSVYDQRGKTDRYRTDVLTDITFGDVKSAHMPYKPDGNPPDKQHVTYTAYPDGSLQKMQNAEPAAAAEYGYTRGLLTKTVSGNNTYTFEYDGFGELTATKLNGEVIAKIKNDTSAKTVTSTLNNYNRRVHCDAQDRPCIVTEWTGSNQSEFTTLSEIDYDEFGRTTSVKDYASGSVGTTQTLSYKPDGSLDKITLSGNRSGEFKETVYDGRVTGKRVEFNGTARNYEYSYSYDRYGSSDYPDNRLAQISFTEAGAQVSYGFDDYGRLQSRHLCGTGEIYDYLKQDSRLTNYVSSIRYERPGYSSGSPSVTERTESYAYNDSGYVSGIYDDSGIAYDYDKLGRLVREDNQKMGFTRTYEYDESGNIKQRNNYGYTTALDLGSPQSTVSYGYATSGDRNRLMSFAGQQISAYDSAGNPCNYRDNVLQWERGRRLAYLADTDEREFYFTYDAGGIRQEKRYYDHDRNDDIVHTYYTEGSRIHREVRSYGEYNNPDKYDNETTKGQLSMWYYYDASGITGIEVNGNKYWFQKNLFGDVKRIYDSSGSLMAEYVYDAWGNHKVYNASGGVLNSYDHEGHIAFVNPFRYRGYYYDQELKLYYLESRYYDPEVGRFINADSVKFLEPSEFGGLNLYVYCGNNPVMRVDPSGNAWYDWLFGGLIIIAAVALSIVTMGAAAVITGAIAGALGGLATSIVTGILVGAAVGALSGAIASCGMSIGIQAITNGFGGIDWAQVGKDTLAGVISGAITGAALGALNGAIIGATKLATKGATATKDIANAAADGISGLSKAQASVNSAKDMVDVALKTGTMAAYRSAQATLTNASTLLRSAESTYNAVYVAYRAGAPLVKFVLGLLIKNFL